jgi:hypothetical protein
MCKFSPKVALTIYIFFHVSLSFFSLTYFSRPVSSQPQKDRSIPARRETAKEEDEKVN